MSASEDAPPAEEGIEPDEHGTVPISAMRGVDDEETADLELLLEGARAYVAAIEGLPAVVEERFGLGVGEVVGVFLFRFEPTDDFPELFWIIADEYAPGHVPFAQAPTPVAALELYAAGLDRWIASAREAAAGADTEAAAAVQQGNIPINDEYIDLFERRVAYLYETVLPFYSDDPS